MDTQLGSYATNKLCFPLKSLHIQCKVFLVRPKACSNFLKADTTLQNKIESAENRAQKIVGCTPIIPSSIATQRKRVVTFVHRVLTSNDVCENFDNYFASNNTGVRTQNNNIMACLPYVKLEVARKSFFFQGAKIYNELPRQIRSENSHLKFKSLLKSL